MSSPVFGFPQNPVDLQNTSIGGIIGPRIFNGAMVPVASPFTVPQPPLAQPLPARAPNVLDPGLVLLALAQAGFANLFNPPSLVGPLQPPGGGALGPLTPRPLAGVRTPRPAQAPQPAPVSPAVTEQPNTAQSVSSEDGGGEGPSDSAGDSAGDGGGGDSTE